MDSFDYLFIDEAGQWAIAKECTESVLDAAHIVSVENGCNDCPTNGLVLRTDVHRLYDKGLFKVDVDGKICDISDISDISDIGGVGEGYLEILKSARIGKKHLNRVVGSLKAVASNKNPSFVSKCE